MSSPYIGVARDQFKRNVIILRGCAGSGKSTCARVLRDKFNGVIISSDSIRSKFGMNSPYDPSRNSEVFSIFEERYLTLMQDPDDDHLLILDATNTSASTVMKYVNMGRDNGYEVIVLTLMCSPDVAMYRVYKRFNNGGMLVPERAVMSQYDDLCHNTRYIQNESFDYIRDVQLFDVLTIDVTNVPEEYYDETLFKL